jgi:hypothetical protein
MSLLFRWTGLVDPVPATGGHLAAELRCEGQRKTGHQPRKRSHPSRHSLIPISNFDTFSSEAFCRIIGRWCDKMPQNEPNTSTPELVKDEKPVDDFFASKLADRIRIDNWRRRLTYIRQEVLEIAEQGSQQGFVGLKRETVKLAKSIERLEALLGLNTIQ